jgi:hypothetical protein
MRRTNLSVCCLLAAGAAFAASAQSGAAKRPASDAKPEHVERYPAFRDAEVRLVKDWFRPGGGHRVPVAPDGSAVPGAVEQQLKRGSTLAEAAKGKTVPFPEGLNKTIPAPPDGYSRLLCGRKALLVADSSALLVDVFDITER